MKKLTDFIISNNEIINFNSFLGGCDQDILQMLDILKLNSGIGGHGAANNNRNNRYKLPIILNSI